MRSLILTAAAGVALALGAQSALAFTYENQGTSQPQSQAKANGAPAIGFGAMDPNSVLPPIGEGEPVKSFDFGPGAFNNGWASQPTRSDSVGPSWLHPPR